MPDNIESIGFYLIPGFTLAAVASAVDVLALTNYVKRESLYRWCFLSLDGEPVRAMNNVWTLADHSIHNAPWLDAITVCSGVNGALYKPPQRLLSWLQKRYAGGAHLGSISTGTWCLARMQLLKGRRFTIHWEDVEAFSETFPSLIPSKEIFEIDGRIFTCSGGTAAVDLFLSFVLERHGTDTANAVSEQLVHGVIRSHRVSQRLSVRERFGLSNQNLVEALTLMEANCESPLPQSEIAARVEVSPRQLERLFRTHFNATPQLYYRRLRLQVAQKLLRQTALPVRQVALAVGFSNASYFANCYRQQFGWPPNTERDA